MGKKICFFVGLVLVLAGLLGFASSPLFGSDAFFATTKTQDVLHLVLGLVLFVGGRGSKGYMVMRSAAIIFFVVAILGFLIGQGKLLSLLNVNLVNSWLYFVLAGALFAGFVSEANTRGGDGVK